ncbi:hypothetical protein BH10BAC5_BH10BAC5_10550 [soil metagenome]
MNTTNKLSFIFLLLIFFASFANKSLFAQEQINVRPISSSELPAGINYEGSIKEAFSFSDAMGENIVITSETGVYKSKKFKHENDGSDAELFAYHFTVDGNKVVQVWRVYDLIKDCPLDIEVNFLKNTLQVTDLNNDGVAEIWLMYKTVCHGDVSPADMKIIMYEGQKKFAMRGQNKVKLSENEFIGGDYKFDNAFNSAPDPFRTFALDLWNKNIMQKWE